MSALCRAAIAAVVIAATLAVAPECVAAEVVPVAIPDLIAHSAELDGAAVTVEGEAIGEALRADAGSVWVNVLADGAAIGAWMPRDIARPIESWGGYRRTGDWVRITGVVNLACDRHGGDLDIHAASVEVVRPGVERAEAVRPRDALIGAAGFALAGVAYLLSRRRSRRESEGR